MNRDTGEATTLTEGGTTQYKHNNVNNRLYVLPGTQLSVNRQYSDYDDQ